MAMTDQDIQRLLDGLEALTRGGGSRLGNVPVGDKGEFEKYLKNLNKEVERGKTSMGGLVKELVTGKKKYADLAATLDDLDEQIEKLGKNVDARSAEEYAALVTKRAEVAQAHRNAVAMRGAMDIVGTAGKTIGTVASTIARGAATVAKDIMNGGDIFTTVADTMDVQLDVQNQTVQGLANAGKTAGSALMAFGPYGVAAGAALIGLSTAASYASEALTEIQKFYNRFVLTEGTKLIQAFQKMSSSGATFSGGMTEMAANAKNAGLTTKQFSDAVAKNADNLSTSGLGVTEGARRMSAALKVGGDSMKKNLLNLGYTFEEQADLVANTMRDMRQSGGPLRASNAEVAAQTQKYAENLRIISGITGEDARKKEEAVRQQANQLAFQQKLANMNESQRLGVINAMKNMSDMERKNFMDMVNFGTVINQEGAAAEALSPGLRNAVGAYYDAFKQGTLDDVEARKISKQYTEQQKKDLLGNTAIGTAGAANVGGLVQSIADNMGKELEYRNKWTKDAIEAAENNTKGQEKTADGLTNMVTDAVKAGQDMSMELEQLAIKNLPHFREAIDDTIKFIKERLAEAGGKPGKEAGLLDKISGAASKGLSGIWEGIKSGGKVGAGIGAAGGGFVGAGAGGVGAIPGAAAGGIGGGVIGGILGGIVGGVKGAYSGWNQAGFAMGGIAKGPTMGHLELLHGTEAVIPLPDGNTVPVSFDGSIDSLTAKIDQFMSTAMNNTTNHDALTAKLDQLMKSMDPGSITKSSISMTTNDSMAKMIEEMNRLMNQQLDATKDMVSHARDTRDYTEKLLKVSM